MRIKNLSEKYLDQFVKVVDEYRSFCGFEKSGKDTKEFFQHLIDTKKAKTFIAIDDNDQVMGFVNLYPSFSTLSLINIWILNDLAVAGKFRRLGVAQALIEKAVKFAERSGAVRVELKTEITNQNAQKLYSKMGFETDKENIHYRIPLNKFGK